MYVSIVLNVTMTNFQHFRQLVAVAEDRTTEAAEEVAAQTKAWHSRLECKVRLAPVSSWTEGIKAAEDHT